MNRPIGSRLSDGSDDDRILLWLIVALVAAMLVVGGLAVMVGRAAGETTRIVASLGVTSPAGRPTVPAPLAVSPSPTPTPASASAPAWYFADGGQAGAFKSSYVVFNPNDAPLQGQITVLRDARSAAPAQTAALR